MTNSLLAAAGVDVLVTANLADFPTDPLKELSVEVMGPDAYLVELFEEFPEEIVATVVRIAGERTRPPMTPEAMLMALRRAGLGESPALVQERLSSPPSERRER